jgi:hypothetical protein
MLHAELRGKVGPDATDGHRKEDVLTSTAFGTIFTAGDWDLLHRWFAKARTLTGAPLVLPPLAEVAYWFWPRLGQTEPDVVLQIGPLLLIVEVKYWSGGSGDDQLVNEWKVCERPANRAFAASIRDAIDATDGRALVYLVQRRKLAAARAFVAQSLERVSDARIFILTWEDLDDALAAQLDTRWRLELRDYLALRGIAAFRGVATTFAAADRELLARASAWRAFRWSKLLPVDSLTSLARLATWRPRFAVRKESDG